MLEAGGMRVCTPGEAGRLDAGLRVQVGVAYGCGLCACPGTAHGRVVLKLSGALELMKTVIGELALAGQS